ncbi:hypothetical protein BKA93DRAFT_824771 [Sparassis latifolia]
MRPLVSYDDITAPQAEPAELPGPHSPPTNPPPSKKRKTNEKLPNRRPQQQYAHWDDPGAQAPPVRYDDGAAGPSTSGTGEGEYTEEEEEEEKSRELTHDEIWDDSALVDAWDSALAEYEAYHGPGKKWKEEPVKRSPLWYNVPPSDSKPKKIAAHSAPAEGAPNGTHEEHANGEADSTPLNFDTYVPTYDPSLTQAVPPHPPAVPGSDYAQYYLPNPPGPMVSQDEAFSRALAAMYWGGYWTAVYHYQRNVATGEIADGEEGGAEAQDADVDAGRYDEDEDMVSAQR